MELMKKRHYEPPGQNVSIVSQICLILVSNCLKRSQFCLKHVSDKMSQFGLQFETFLTFETQLRLPLFEEQFESNLRHFSALSKRCQKGLQTCLKKGFGGFSGSMVDRWSFQVRSLYIQTLWFHNYNCMVYSTIAPTICWSLVISYTVSHVYILNIRIMKNKPWEDS